MHSSFTTGSIARRACLDLESLEVRDVPAGVALSAAGVLTVTATDKGDTVTMKMDNNGTPGNIADDKVKIVWAHDGVTETKSFAAKDVKEIVFAGGKGNDTVFNNTNIKSTLRGGEGADTLHGGSNNDHIEGGKGNDKLYGEEGHDDIWAYKSNSSTIEGSMDILYGGQGDDFLFGVNGGTNYLYGGTGDDALYGGDVAGINFMYGGADHDTLYGGDGASAFVMMNHMIDNQGANLYWGGDNAWNFMDASDNNTVGVFTDDIIIQGQNSFNTWWSEGLNYNGYYETGDHVFTSWLTYEIWKNGW